MELTMKFAVKRASDISSSPRLTSRHYTGPHAFRKWKQSRYRSPIRDLMLLPQKELCLEECQIEASDYGLVSDARLGSAARRRTILIFFREAKFSSPPSLPLWPDRAAGAP